MERYRLGELARVTDLTPRTIRYYIAEGLLPPPEGLGPAAVYTAAHRDRLALIALLKDRYLPLREIRRRLAALSDGEVREELVREGRAPAPSPRWETAPPAEAALASAPGGNGRERWERITLGNGVELHVREDRRRETAPLEALIRHARGLLGSGQG